MCLLDLLIVLSDVGRYLPRVRGPWCTDIVSVDRTPTSVRPRAFWSCETMHGKTAIAKFTSVAADDGDGGGVHDGDDARGATTTNGYGYHVDRMTVTFILAAIPTGNADLTTEPAANARLVNGRSADSQLFVLIRLAKMEREIIRNNRRIYSSASRK